MVKAIPINTPKPKRTNTYPYQYEYFYRKDKEHKEGFTKEDIKLEGNKISARLAKIGVKNSGIEVYYKYPNRHYNSLITRAGKEIDTTSHSLLYDNEGEPEYFPEFAIYVITDAYSNEGGCNGEYNDCLYESLLKIIGAKFKLRFKTAEQFKLELNIERKAKISLSKMAEVEEIINKSTLSKDNYESPLYHKYKINVACKDNNYKSKLDYKCSVYLVLINDHYYPNLKEQPYIIHGISKKERIPLIYMTDRENPMNKVYYDPEKKKDIIIKGSEFSKTLYHNSLYDPDNSKYVLIPIDKIKNKKENKDRKLIDYYNEFVKDADELKKEKYFGYHINLYKTGTTITTALDILRSVGGRKINPESLTDEEDEMFFNQQNGDLMFGCPSYKGKVYEYDIISAFPSIYSSQYLRIPFKQGEAKKYDKLPEKLEYGLYHCYISATNKKLFKTPLSNIYTHFDIQRALELNYKIEMDKTKDYNAIIYTSDKLICASQIFLDYVKYIYPLKKKGNKIAIQLLKIIWGVLCQKNVLKKKVSDNRQTLNLVGKEVQTIDRISETEHMVTFFDPTKKLFCFNWCRIGAFIRGKLRQKMSKLIEKHLDKIVYLRTDGFYTTEQLNIKVGEKIGDLRLKSIKEVEIQTMRVKVLSEKKL